MTQTKTNNKLKTLYTRLANFGFSKNFIKKNVFPNWWKDEIADDYNGYLLALGFISSFLGIDYDTLKDETSELKTIHSFGNYMYKTNKPKEKLEITTYLLLTIASIILENEKKDYNNSLFSHTELRDYVLKNNSCVNLNNILDYCWSKRIPVLFINTFKEIKQKTKPDGISAFINERPIIILTNDKLESWLLFHLLHELGHITNNHLENDSFLVDKELLEKDEKEIEASEFANKVIYGDFTLRINYDLSVDKLIEYAKKEGKRNNINYGSIALKYGHYKEGKRYGVVSDALKQLGEKKAKDIILRKMVEQIDWERIPNDRKDFIIRTMKLEEYFNGRLY